MLPSSRRLTSRKDMIKAPWTDEQVKNLNEFQQCGVCHPFTCGGKKDGKDCRADLVATKDGWICPDGCGYKQDWAHESMADGSDVAHMMPFIQALKKSALKEDQDEQSSGEQT